MGGTITSEGGLEQILAAAPTDSEIRRHYSLKHEWIFEKGNYTELPDINPDYIQLLGKSGKSIDDFENKIKILKDFLCNTYIIRDHMGDNHQKRREFYDQQPEFARKWLDAHSKLRSNKLTAVSMALYMLMGDIKDVDAVTGDKLEQVFNPRYLDLCNMIKHEYPSMNFEQKVEFVGAVEKIAYGFLKILEQPSFKLREYVSLGKIDYKDVQAVPGRAKFLGNEIPAFQMNFGF